MNNILARYAVKVLFQMRLDNESSGCYRTTEERIFLLNARDARSAFDAAKKRCKREEFSSNSESGANFNFEFVGIVELIHLGVEVADEVWYEVKKMKSPMERKGVITKDFKETAAASYEAVKGARIFS